MTVVGATEDYADMVETFTTGHARFPLDHGLAVAVSLTASPAADAVLAEAAHFVKFTAADAILALHPPLDRMEPDDARALRLRLDAWRLRHGNIEMTFLPAPGPGVEALVRGGGHRVGGSGGVSPTGGEAQGGETGGDEPPPAHPGSVRFGGGFRIRVPLALVSGEDEEERQGAREAIDMAAHSGTVLQTVGVLPPQFLPGEGTLHDIRGQISRIREEASVHGVTIRRRIRRGNPVRVVDELGSNYLVVMGLGGHPYTYLRPGIVGLLVATVDCSVILVPARGLTGHGIGRRHHADPGGSGGAGTSRWELAGSACRRWSWKSCSGCWWVRCCRSFSRRGSLSLSPSWAF